MAVRLVVLDWPFVTIDDGPVGVGRLGGVGRYDSILTGGGGGCRGYSESGGGGAGGETCGRRLFGCQDDLATNFDPLLGLEGLIILSTILSSDVSDP